MSYKMKISTRDRSAGRFKSRVHRALMKAVIAAKNEKGITQSQIAEMMEVDKSVVSRILNGHGNLTLKTIGEISWVLGLRPEISFAKLDDGLLPNSNQIPHQLFVAAEMKKTSKDSNVWVAHATRPQVTTFSSSVSQTATSTSKWEESNAH